MSTAVDVYLVPVEKLRKVPRSKNKRLLTAVRKQKDFLEMVDEIGEDFEEEEEGRPPTCAEAVAQIINGERYDDEFGYVYGYAYEAICMTIGREVHPNWCPSGSYDWFEDIDKALASLKVPLKVTELTYRGCLLKLPKPDDFPGLGWWRATEITRAARAFEAVDLDDLDKKTAKLVEPVKDAISDVRSWITQAARRKGEWMVGVHS